MRHWLFHPLFFYPLLAVSAVVLIFLSLRPDIGPAPAAAAQAGRIEGQSIVLDGAALAHPDVAADQVIHVTRDAWGRPLGVKLAVLPDQPPPGPAETEARFLLAPETAARIAGRAVIVDVSLEPLPVTNASAIAVSLQGAGAAEWSTRELAPQSQTLRFHLPAVADPQAVGVRAISTLNDYNYGFQITRIRIAPDPTALRN